MYKKKNIKYNSEKTAAKPDNVWLCVILNCSFAKLPAVGRVSVKGLLFFCFSCKLLSEIEDIVLLIS